MYLTTGQAARQLGVTRQIVWYWINKGLLTSEQTEGKRHLISEDDLKSFVSARHRKQKTITIDTLRVSRIDFLNEDGELTRSMVFNDIHSPLLD